MTNSIRKITATAGASAAGLGLALGTMALGSPAASASTAPVTVGVGVSYQGAYIAGHGFTPYIGATIGTVSGQAAWVPAPQAPGTSTGYQVTFTNTGSATESIGVQTDPATLTGNTFWTGAPGAPAQAVAWTSGIVGGPVTLAAGKSVTETVTVAIPAGAPAGTYYGTVMGTTIVTSSGKTITEAAGAGIREYLAVS